MNIVDPKSVGGRLRAWRVSHQLSQEAFAILCKMGTGNGPVISLYEQGKRTPSFAAALAIEKATGNELRVERWGYNRSTATRRTDATP